RAPADIRGEQCVVVEAGALRFHEALQILDAGPERDLSAERMLEADEEARGMVGRRLVERLQRVAHGVDLSERVIAPDVVLEVVTELAPERHGVRLDEEILRAGIDVQTEV